MRVMPLRWAGGFSYVEMMFTIAILAMLASMATPFLQTTLQRSKEAELRQNLRDIRAAIDAYKLASDQGKIEKSIGDSGYPEKLDDLVLGKTNKTDPNGAKLRFLRRIPADPMYSGEPVTPTDTWGKRSYESDAAQPQEGRDVYDVYSLNPQFGLNGLPYNQW